MTPDDSTTPTPPQAVKPVGWRTYVALVLLAFAPRAAMAVKIDTICPDGAYYLAASRDLEHGDPQHRLTHEHFNGFLTAERLLTVGGVDGEVAFRAINLVAATLLVLPVFGWLRRQFDPRIAWIACLLLAFHPKLIEWSAEIVREPLFLLAFATALYCGWRSVQESRVRWFVAAGLAASLAIQTRFEGWLVLLPLMAWTVEHAYRMRNERRTLVKGCLAAAMTFPALVLAMNLLMYPGLHEFQWGANLHKLVYFRGVTEPLALPPATVAATATGPAVASATTHNRTFILLKTLERGYSPLWGMLAIVGVCTSWRLLLRRDVLVLWLTIGLSLLAIWVHLRNAPDSSSRYLLLPMILSLPSMAWGFTWLVDRLERTAGRWLHTMPIRLTPRTIGIGLVVTLAAVGTADALSSRDTGRTLQASLGRWLRGFGEQPVIAGPIEYRTLGYYAEGDFLPLPEPNDPTAIAAFAGEHRANLIVLDEKHHAIDVDRLQSELARVGFDSLRFSYGAGASAFSIVLATPQSGATGRTARR